MTAVRPSFAWLAVLVLAVASLNAAAASAQAAPAPRQQLERLASPLATNAAPAFHEAAAGMTLRIDEPSPGDLYLASFAGLAGGYLLGGLAGFRIEQAHSSYCDMFCGVGGALRGAPTGGSVGATFGAHAANDFGGNALLGTGGTVLAGAGAVVLTAAATAAVPGAALLLLGVPIVQVHTAVQIEQLTARRRAAR
jgi:hypothetical protein